jgi:hypothetical protein
MVILNQLIDDDIEMKGDDKINALTMMARNLID